MLENYNINTIENLDEDTRNIVISYFELYAAAKKHKDLYKVDKDSSAVKAILDFYFKLVKPDYSKLIYNFRNKYISNEILVEKNNSVLERRGLALVYDYIQCFDIDKDYFNIFVCSLMIHSKLYEPFDELAARSNISLEEIIKLEEEARDKNDLKKLAEIRELKEKHGNAAHFGGRLRDTSVYMADTSVEVPSSKEALDYMNSFLSGEKIQEYDHHLKEDNIFDYINYCVREVIQLIFYQPFQDGNKRTFRSLLNLMFKKRNIPPVYIYPNEREEYKEAILEAIKTNDYTRICGFYYYKICDSIYELDIKPYLNKKDGRSK
jgi:fido (protein-threonine AMPylation protein)